MNKKMVKIFIGICVVCAAGFELGYSMKKTFNEKAIAADEYGTEVKKERFAEVFPEDIYTCSYNNSTGSYVFTKKNSMEKSINGKEAYQRSDDTLSIMQKILGCKYDIVLEDCSEGSIIYLEYKDGYRTGAFAGFAYDENGFMIEARFREGKMYDFDEEAMIPYEEAYNIGIEALYKKYGENTVLNVTSADCPYEVMYRPDLNMMCYCIEEVNGYMNGKDGGFEGEVVFTLFVSVDGTLAQVASTLCY